jgi:DNA cross-link repair 1A protein
MNALREIFPGEMNRQVERKPPAHAIVPGTDFTVDWHCKTLPKYQHSFLSHAHEDHLVGVRSFQPPSILHCTPITARMLLLKVPKVRPCIEVHEPNSSFKLGAVTIHILNANHTPGSAIFVFILPNGSKILHTGDFRAETSVIANVSKFSPVDHLFIDCTFALSGLSIPPRKIATDFVIEKARFYLQRDFLIIIGTYTLGKEDLVLDVAEALACAVYAPEIRLKGILDLMECGWRRSPMFTSDSAGSRIHLVPIQQSAPDRAYEYAVSVGRTRICAFRVTGWSGKPYWESPDIITARGIEAVAFSVPYSDHSAPSELVEFVAAVKPVKVTSTTQTAEKDIAKIQTLFFPYLRKEKNRGFIDFYGTTVRTCSSAPATDDSQACAPGGFLDDDDDPDVPIE